MTSTAPLRVDPGNAEQARAWDGDEGDYWAAHSELFERSTAAYDARLLEAARIGSDAEVLDIGCGTGKTTRDVARIATAGSALGVDLSARMLEVARRRAEDEGLLNARFDQGDAQIYPFGRESFDAAVSRTGAMFFSDHRAAFTNVARALRPGGRLVLLVWQALPRNEWMLHFSAALAAGRRLPAPPPDAPGPFSLSDPNRVRNVLLAAGFAEPNVESLEEGMYFGAHTDDAYSFVLGSTGWMLEGLDDDDRARALDALRNDISAHEADDGVVYGSAAWLVTASRR